ncbi:DUF6188 family protein [Alteribacter natronophilus]|uniref:DUF6188 family protein n=1 Tax=Alteribacter natronophilus TaxID=2583810 RepID=UPI00110D3FB4|nr:DUF6188 family protein [Alteribacter natronophilus]TMW70868.1 hypothetical protein FGB90_12855 [Alteribacter natronophilus]
MTCKLNLDHFTGLTVTDVKKKKPHPLILDFCSGGLSVECPWRLTAKGSIVVGQTDFLASGKNEYYKTLLSDSLDRKTVKKAEWLDDCYMLRIVLSEGYILDMFHDSSEQEGWELYHHDGFSLISLPGGEPEISGKKRGTE